MAFIDGATSKTEPDGISLVRIIKNRVNQRTESSFLQTALELEFSIAQP
jgi:hypothetical protein